MSEFNIEHSGVHYASHALLEAQRELERELMKIRAADAFGVKRDPEEYRPPTALAITDNYGNATDRQYGRIAPADGMLRVTDNLDRLGRNPPADHTIRQIEGEKPTPMEVLRTPMQSNCPSPAAYRDALVVVERQVAPAPEPAEPLPAEVEAAREFIRENPRYRGEFEKILQRIRQNRVKREKLESLEDFVRNSLADVWALEWEEIYELNVRCRQRAAEDMRARLSNENWHNHLEVRRAELEQRLAERQEEMVFHTEDILRELDMRVDYLQIWKEQLASFLTLEQLLEWTQQPAIEDRKM